MKTAVSIPDDVFEQAERLARAAGKTRSQVYREALAEYLARRDPGAVTRALNETVEATGASPDGWSRATAERALRRSEW